MSIDIETLQRTFQPSTLPRPKTGDGDGTAFAAVFAALGEGKGGSAAAQRDAVQELMRIELMQSSLSIGDAGAPHSYQSPALASLLKGLAAYKDAAQAAQGGAAAAAQPPAMPPQLQEIGADSGAISRTASEFLGTPYRFGGEGPSGIDCSSFVQQVFREHQINLPRTAREQITVGKDVAREDVKEGDLVFFRTYASYPSHVGIYLGNGKMIHASSKAGEVTVSDMNTEYFQARYIGAKRVA